jgi:two-component system cell cycle sensor histidine kinase PleC
MEHQRDRGPRLSPSEDRETWSARSLVTGAPALHWQTPCAEIETFFVERPEVMIAAVLRDGRPVGLMERDVFFARWARPFHRELYERRPITALMNRKPLIVDADTSLAALSDLILTDRPGAAFAGFIVTEGGSYLGVGTALQLVGRVADQAQQREREAQAAWRAAERASRIKSEFLANMSHELRTPLNAIIGFSEIMIGGSFGSIDNPRYREYLDDIRRSGEHLLSLINDILDLSKAEAGRLELIEETVDLGEIVAGSVRLVSTRALRSDVVLRVDAAPDLPALRADRRKLQQILLNLLTNAVKFTAGGGRVEIAAAPTADGGVTVTVADTGIGIAKDDIPKALEPFGQVGRAAAREQEGTGLGLPLTRRLVDLHGGRFTLDSVLGVGTVAAVWLPPERCVARPPREEGREEGQRAASARLTAS